MGKQANLSERTVLESLDCEGTPADLQGSVDVADERLAGSMESRPDTDIEIPVAGVFRFKTLEAARYLALMLANACPEPGKVVLGLTELMINAVEHGNLEISYEEKTRLFEMDCWDSEVRRRLSETPYADRQVRVEFERLRDRIQVTITDEGRGFDWRQYLDIDPARLNHQHGRGIAMSRLISFDDVEYHGPGNQVSVGILLDEAD